MHNSSSRFFACVLLLTVVALACGGCQPASGPKTAPAAGITASPPPPPGSPPAGTPASAATPSGLPTDLVAKIDELIAAHKAYTTLAEKVQSVEDFKQHQGELSQLSQRSSDAFEEVLIASAKLPADQKSKWEAYMDQHVTPVNDVRRQQYERVQRLLPQDKLQIDHCQFAI